MEDEGQIRVDGRNRRTFWVPEFNPAIPLRSITTIVPARDKAAAAKFFAEVFSLTVRSLRRFSSG